MDPIHEAYPRTICVCLFACIQDISKKLLTNFIYILEKKKLWLEAWNKRLDSEADPNMYADPGFFVPIFFVGGGMHSLSVF